MQKRQPLAEQAWIAGWVGWATIVLVIIVMTLGYLSYISAEKAIVEEFNSRQRVLAEEAATGIELYFETVAGELKTLSDDPAVQALDENESRRELAAHFKKIKPIGVNDLALLDADGVLLYNVATPQIEGSDFAFRQYFIDSKDSNDPDDYFIELVEFGEVKFGHKSVAVAMPVFREGPDGDKTFSGVVLATLELKTVTQRFVAPLGSRHGAEAYLIDNLSDVLWAPAAGLFGQKLYKEARGFPEFRRTIAKMRDERKGSGEYTYYMFSRSKRQFLKDTARTLISYAPVSPGNAQWTIGVWAPKRDALLLVRSALITLLILVAVIIAAITSVSAYAYLLSARAGRILEERVRDRTAELNGLNASLVRSNAELERFAYIASRDLQEPLRMVTGHIQLISKRYRGKLDPEGDEFIDFATEGAARMKMLLDDLLTYTRLSEGPKRLPLEEAGNVLEQALVGLKPLIEESGAEITSGSLPRIRFDASRLSQVFSNLISNAIKFRGEDPPRIDVSAKFSEDEWIFSVSDNGIGIEPKYYDKVFLIFQRLHPRDRYPGTGLGLAVCKKIVERRGGRIWLKSKPGEGSTFYFSVPDGEERINETGQHGSSRSLSCRG